MGRKARQKKMRHSAKAENKTIDEKYSSTEFVKQFEKMGYRLKPNLQKQQKSNQNDFPEIPQDKIEPQI